MAELLSDIERKGAVWLKLKKHFEERLEAKRKQVEGNVSQEETQKLRGRIAEIRELLRLGDEQPKVEPEQHID